ncbi:homocysteine S-methyltransferase family protein [Desulfonatronum sp. SC1]|uniref:homocysteine S-methyltransferase family protein n=1 Tax=Desulfonatronum sp. SC1 TaxID=2109626 RepID=UPI000D3052D1|nr:homocysteine S-methyltransferase family protein [Desulfonatronum sp. SC1]PTN38246.1 methionine synthase [Desulfonatronum sp. SC1]
MSQKVRELIQSGKILLFDGAMGTQLQARGLQPGQSPEEFGDRNPEVIARIHEDYLNAGAMFLTTNTFGGTRFKLPPGLDPRSFNRKMAETARSAAGVKGFVAGSVGPTGELLAPLGKIGFSELVDAFSEQIAGLAQGGADLIQIETQFDLGEIRAAVVAARQVCDLPLAVSMTFESGSSLTGTSPLTFLDTMQNLGVDLIGTNCSLGPEGLEEIIRAMLPRATTPLLVQPNAGLPVLENGKTVFPLQPQPFAERMLRFPALGVQSVGGCCGTSPDHIRAMAQALRDVDVAPLEARNVTGGPDLILTSRAVSVCIGPREPLVIIGERINPTGKKQLTAQFQAGEHGLALDMAGQQIAQGARVLDVNVGAPMVDETILLPDLVSILTARFPTPLSIDSSKPEAIEAALRQYPGSPLVNSISGESGRMEALGPLCRTYGAPFILLPLAGSDLPETASQRLKIIENLLRRAEDLGIPRRLIMVDALALTVSSKPESAKHCLQTIRACREEWNLPTVVGLSNISFGLPARELLNSTFLAMAMAHGLCAVIAHPGARRVQEILAAGEVLLARDAQAKSFVGGYADWSGGGTGSAVTGLGGPAAKPALTLGEAVIQGDKDRILDLLETALQGGAQPGVLLDEELIPAIMEVGRRYETREFFLPQLILSAETMQRAFDRLTPLLRLNAGDAQRARIVMATVEGDIHDIGKNIVCLMLRNMGFEVHDLGKDVPAEVIVRAAQDKQAGLIGLSALMTTTMVRMEDTVRMVNELGLSTKVMVGGAVVTEHFAQSIGADGYAPDAVAAVRLAAKLLGENGRSPLEAS